MLTRFAAEVNPEYPGKTGKNRVWFGKRTGRAMVVRESVGQHHEVNELFRVTRCYLLTMASAMSCLSGRTRDIAAHQGSPLDSWGRPCQLTTPAPCRLGPEYSPYIARRFRFDQRLADNGLAREAYHQVAKYRNSAPSEAAALGASAALVRSVGGEPSTDFLIRGGRTGNPSRCLSQLRLYRQKTRI